MARGGATGTVAGPDLWREARDAGLRPMPARRALSRGACLRPASPDDWLYQLRRGGLRISRLTVSGRKLDLDTVRAPSFLFGPRLHGALAEAVEDCDMVILTRVQFDVLIAVPALRPLVANMLDSFGRSLVSTEERLEYQAYHSVPERVALALLRLRNEENGIIDGITHQQLGDTVGACRETVTKVLHTFQDRGYIGIAHRRIKVFNPTALAMMLDV